MLKDKLVEDFLSTTDNKEFLEELGIGDHENNREFSYVYVVYEKDTKYLIKAIWGDKEERDKWYGFREALDNYIQREKSLKLSDYMFFLDVYDRVKFENLKIEDIYNREFENNEIVDEILSDSKGFLLWHYQLENLIGLFSNDTTEPVRFRKGLHSRKDEFLEEAKNMKFVDGLNLFDLLRQRTIPIAKNIATTRRPTWQNAYNLCNALKR